MYVSLAARVLWLLACLLCSAPARAGFAQHASKPAPTCADCHSPITDTQPGTPMGRALLLPAANTALKAHPALTLTRGAYTYTVQTGAAGSTYSVTDGSRTITVPVIWGFGAHNQTWMLEHDGKMYESLVSYYPVVNGLAITTGDDRLQPATLEDALGRELSAIDVKTCFGCHASNPLAPGTTATSMPTTSPAATAPDPHSVQAGVNCEHCHLGAARHLLDASQDNFSTVPPRLGKLTTEDMSQFCGQCHRTWDMVVRSHWRGQMNVRFQPYRLANSRCYNGTDARISCVACHNPHEDVRRDAAFYDGKCLACHAGTPHVVAASQRSGPAQETPKSCPVAKTNCVSCHMPKVVLPSSGDHLAFTDHQIRVVRAGDAYPN